MAVVGVGKTGDSAIAIGRIWVYKNCSCGKFYLDTTRNKNRRWCNPLICGNSVRSKKYYATRKGMAAA
ncbi:CGNR zinc finger domain-containing protein [Mucilaginibacter flavidus]|uniref:CGNR zinc finger domain-containing protein n=1 Tax=Mucilaginibacter flavidus TaxID=2949309 RepID=UPI0035194372